MFSIVIPEIILTFVSTNDKIYSSNDMIHFKLTDTDDNLIIANTKDKTSAKGAEVVTYDITKQDKNSFLTFIKIHCLLNNLTPVEEYIYTAIVLDTINEEFKMNYKDVLYMDAYIIHILAKKSCYSTSTIRRGIYSLATKGVIAEVDKNKYTLEPDFDIIKYFNPDKPIQFINIKLNPCIF